MNDINDLSRHIRDEILNRPPCENGNHWFVPYNVSTLVCKNCGIFAKVGRLYRNPKEKGRS